MKLYIPITKIVEHADGSCSLYGVAASEAKDDVGEVFDYDTSKPYFQAWSSGIAKATDGKSLGNIRAMHNKLAAGKATELNFDDATKTLHLGAHIIDANEANKCREGVYSGFSIGGSYVKRWPDTNQRGAYRYTAKPSEISIVDIPSNPDATFNMVKMDGSSSMEKFAVPTQEMILHKIQYMAEKQAESFGDLVKFLSSNGVEKTEHSVEGFPLEKEDTPVCPHCGSEHEPEKCSMRKETNSVSVENKEVEKGVRHLVTDDKGNKHLPVTDESGKPDPRHMGAAWAALHSNYRVHSYEGPDKDKAIASLNSMYEQAGVPKPAEKYAGDAPAEFARIAREHWQDANRMIQGLGSKREFAKLTADLQTMGALNERINSIERSAGSDSSTAPVQLAGVIADLHALQSSIVTEMYSGIDAALGKAAAETQKEVALMDATIKSLGKLVAGATDDIKKAAGPHLMALQEHAEQIHKAAGNIGKCFGKMADCHGELDKIHGEAMDHHARLMEASGALLGKNLEGTGIGGPEPGITGGKETDVTDAGRESSKEETESGLGMKGDERHGADESATEKMIKAGFAGLEKKLASSFDSLTKKNDDRLTEIEKKNDERFAAIEKVQTGFLGLVKKLTGTPEPAANGGTQVQRTAETSAVTRLDKGAEANNLGGGNSNGNELGQDRTAELQKKAKEGTITENEKRELWRSIPATRGEGIAPNLRIER